MKGYRLNPDIDFVMKIMQGTEKKKDIVLVVSSKMKQHFALVMNLLKKVFVNVICLFQ